MIFLYDEDETRFETLGNGVLKDAISCEIVEELNGNFELEMVYPISGAHYKDISLRKILYTKPNKYDDYQAFRIYLISKPIDGKVTINAEHLSYDLSGYIINPFEEEATGIQDAFTKIKSHIVGTFPFDFYTDINNTESKFNLLSPASVRSVLAGTSGSLLDVFGGEYKFDNYRIILNKNRGEDRGFKIIFGKNMTELTQELKSEKLYTDVYPYYYRIVTETTTKTENTYQKVYIRTAGEGEEPIQPYTKEWLSLSPGASAFIPLIKKVPVRVESEGEYYHKILIWDDYADPETGETKTKYFEVSGDDYPPNIPTTTSESKEVTEMVVLDEKTIPIEGRTDISPKRVLSLDLTSQFNEKPTQQQLLEAANDYISNNKIGDIVETVEASFIKINDITSSSGIKLINNSICMLGDYIHVYYNEIGVDSSLQVISVTYDVINDSYIEIGLGKKQSTLSDNAMSIGDNVSLLTNDASYTDEIKVNELIAKTITADYIKATNVDFTQAQIETLSSDNIIANGIIQAAEGSIDTLVAELLVTDNASIRNQLIVGDNIIVNGEINIKSGSITIVTDDNIEYINAYIDKTADEDPSKRYRNEWLKKSFNGDEFIEPDATKVYKVYDVYNIWTQSYYVWDSDDELYKENFNLSPEVCFEVDSEGNLTANSADIRGKIVAVEGEIGGCEIIDGVLTVEAANIAGTLSANMIEGGIISSSQINIGCSKIIKDSYIVGSTPLASDWLSGSKNGQPFDDQPNEYYYKIVSSNILYQNKYYKFTNPVYEEITDIDEMFNFVADSNGSVSIKSGEINLGWDSTSRDYNFSVDNNGSVTIKSGEINLGWDSTSQDYNFNVDNYGNVSIKSGEINLGNGNFVANSEGVVTLRSVIIESATINGTDKVSIVGDDAEFDSLVAEEAKITSLNILDSMKLGDISIEASTTDEYTSATGRFNITVTHKNYTNGFSDIIVTIKCETSSGQALNEKDSGTVTINEISGNIDVYISASIVNRISFSKTNITMSVKEGYSFIVFSVPYSVVAVAFPAGSPYHSPLNFTYNKFVRDGIKQLTFKDSYLFAAGIGSSSDPISSIYMDSFIIKEQFFGTKSNKTVLPLAYSTYPYTMGEGFGTYSGIANLPVRKGNNQPSNVVLGTNINSENYEIVSIQLTMIYPDDIPDLDNFTIPYDSRDYNNCFAYYYTDSLGWYHVVIFNPQPIAIDVSYTITYKSI